MPKYHVTMTRTLELATTIPVNATTEEDAQAQAAQLARDAALTWESDGTYAWETLVDVVSVESVERA